MPKRTAFASIRSAWAGFINNQRARRKDLAKRDASVRGPLYVLTKSASHIAGAAYNDLVHGWKKRVRKGDAPIGQRAAIYLIFPDQGLLKSHCESLSYLRAKGYAPVVVSNLTLGDQDRETLRSLSHLVIERYNFGYDFGGYRDGVLALKRHLANLEMLAFFNDSAWFPIQTSAAWLDRAEAMNLDFVGASWGNFAHASKLQDVASFEFSFDPDLRTFHYQSYALLCQRNFLRSQKFLKFWKRFPLTQLKHLTIRRGEIGFSQLAIRNGFTHGATLDPQQIVASLNALTDSALKSALLALPISPSDTQLPSERDRVLTAEFYDRRQAINVILITISRHSVVNVWFDYLVEHCDFDFLKKPPLWLTRDSSAKMLGFIARLESPSANTIRAEALGLSQREIAE